MRPLPDRAYRGDGNPVTFHERLEATSPQGAVVSTWDEVGVELLASVQGSPPGRMEPDGTVVSEATYNVLTKLDPGTLVTRAVKGVREGDQFRWNGRRFNAQGPSVDEGGVGIGWTTNCKEIV